MHTGHDTRREGSTFELEIISPPDWDTAPELPIIATPVPGRVLFFSDNPETITREVMPSNQQGLVLWHHKVDEADRASCDLRAFFWHVNATDQPLVVGLTLENRSSDDLLVRKGAATRALDTQSGDYFLAGQMIARKTLAGDQDPFLNDNLALPASDYSREDSTVILEGALLQPGEHFFACYDWTVERSDGQPGPLCFEVRGVAGFECLNRDLAAPLPAEPLAGGDLYGHARGAWPYSRIRIDMVRPFCCTGVNQTARLLLAQRLDPTTGTPDVELFRETTALPYCGAQDSDPPGKWIKANKGLYGVDYDPFCIRAQNRLPVDRTVRVLVGTLTPGRTESGLVHGLVGAVDAGANVLSLPFSGSSLSYLCYPLQDVAHVLDLRVPAGEIAEASFRFQIGGASTLPWYVVLVEQD